MLCDSRNGYLHVSKETRHLVLPNKHLHANRVNALLDCQFSAQCIRSTSSVSTEPVVAARCSTDLASPSATAKILREHNNSEDSQDVVLGL